MTENKQSFGIGETVHFMKNNEPASGKITGIITYEGSCRGIYGEKVAPHDSKIIDYTIGSFETINKTKAFSSKKRLQESLFNEDKKETLVPGEEEV